MTMEPSAALGAAAAAGLLGSLHCAAMCGPLAIAAGARPDGSADLRATAAYLAGRFASYAALGALFGALGAHALCKLPVATAQWIAVVLVAGAAGYRGVSLLLARRAPAIAPGTVPLRTRAPRRPFTVRLLAFLPRRAGALGLATGVLPCGMLIPAWTLAAVSARPGVGALVMLTFAATSAPGLLLPLASRRVLARVTARLPASTAGLAWCALALWIAARPLLASVHHHH
jgi:sulfite exporter TauE/SafE